MNEPAEEIPTLETIGRAQRGRVAALGWEEVERAMRPVLVVIAAVDAEHVLEVAATEYEDAVEAIGAATQARCSDASE